MTNSVEMVQGESKILAYAVTNEAGVAVNVTGATCLWELSRTPGGIAILTKTTSSGISVSGTTIEVTIDAADTVTLEGLYYHELTILDTASNTSKPQGVLLVTAEIQPEPTP